MTAKPKPLIPSTSTLGLGLRPNTVYGVTVLSAVIRFYLRSIRAFDLVQILFVNANNGGCTQMMLKGIYYPTYFNFRRPEVNQQTNFFASTLKVIHALGKMAWIQGLHSL